MNVEKYRKDMPIVDYYTFLDHANMAPSPKQVLEAVKEVMEEKTKHANLLLRIKWNQQVEESRKNLAKLIGAKKTEEVWFMNTASDGLNIAANIIDFHSGDNVVLSDLEFPSNVYPWLRKKKDGVEVRFVKSNFERDGTINIDVNEFERLIDDRTRAVAVSSVDFTFGYKLDLKEISNIAHEHDALLVVDACQSVGAMKTEAAKDDVDIIAFGGQKWTLAPSAGGGFYMKHDLISKYEPPYIGWKSVRDTKAQFVDGYYKSKYDLIDDAQRFATGHYNYLCIIGLGTSANFLLEIGLDDIEKRTLKLTERLMDDLDRLGYRIITPREDYKRAGIVTFEINDPANKVKKLKSKKIIVSARSNRMRVSPFFYNTEEEIDAFIAEIKNFEK